MRGSTVETLAAKVEGCEFVAVCWVAFFALDAVATGGEGEEDFVAGGDMGDSRADLFYDAGAWILLVLYATDFLVN